jgi:hypothetical protein
MGLPMSRTYDHSVLHGPIRVYHTIDSRFILEVFFAKLRQFLGPLPEAVQDTGSDLVPRRSRRPRVRPAWSGRLLLRRRRQRPNPPAHGEWPPATGDVQAAR